MAAQKTSAQFQPLQQTYYTTYSSSISSCARTWLWIIFISYPFSYLIGRLREQFTVCYCAASQHLPQCGSSPGPRENGLVTIY